MSERWWILDGGFRWNPPRGGRLFSGPYSAEQDAYTARRAIEALDRKGMAYFIEREPGPTPPDSRSDS